MVIFPGRKDLLFGKNIRDFLIPEDYICCAAALEMVALLNTYEFIDYSVIGLNKKYLALLAPINKNEIIALELTIESMENITSKKEILMRSAGDLLRRRFRRIEGGDKEELAG